MARHKDNHQCSQLCYKAEGKLYRCLACDKVVIIEPAK